jgi:tripartite-type tricarboxylate transporter receptor subunit TctC
MLTATHHVINPGLYKKLKYDTRTDFTPIALIAAVPNVLVVNPSLPPRTCRSWSRYAKDNPGKLSFGSTGIGGRQPPGGRAVQGDDRHRAWCTSRTRARRRR